MEENKKMLDKFGKRLSEIPAIQYHADVSGYSFDGAGPSMGMVFGFLASVGRKEK